MHTELKNKKDNLSEKIKLQMKREIIDKTEEIKTLFINNFQRLIYLNHWPIILAQDLYSYDVFEMILHHAHAARP